jgi:hypothetical protein
MWTEWCLRQESPLTEIVTMLRGFILTSEGHTYLEALSAQIMPTQVSCVFSITSRRLR